MSADHVALCILLVSGHLDKLSPAEVAEVVCLRREGPYFTFSDGKIHGANIHERGALAKPLASRNFRP